MKLRGPTAGEKRCTENSPLFKLCAEATPVTSMLATMATQASKRTLMTKSPRAAKTKDETGTNRCEAQTRMGSCEDATLEGLPEHRPRAASLGVARARDSAETSLTPPEPGASFARLLPPSSPFPAGTAIRCIGFP